MSPTPTNPRRRSSKPWLPRWAFVTLGVTVVASLLGMGAAHAALQRAGARWTREGLALLSSLPEETHDGVVASLNGQRLRVASRTDPRPPHAVLESFVEACTGASSNPLQIPKGLRSETEKGGLATCIAEPTSSAPRPFWQRAQAFAASLDLSDLGETRVAFVKRTESGGSFLVTVSTEGSFRLSALVPTPATDMPEWGLPPPPGALRLLEATVHSAPFGAFVFQSPRAPREALETYEGLLKTRGYERQASEVPSGDQVRLYGNAHQDLWVSAANREGSTLLSVAVAFRDGRPSPANPPPSEVRPDPRSEDGQKTDRER